MAKRVKGGVDLEIDSSDYESGIKDVIKSTEKLGKELGDTSRSMADVDKATDKTGDAYDDHTKQLKSVTKELQYLNEKTDEQTRLQSELNAKAANTANQGFFAMGSAVQALASNLVDAAAIIADMAEKEATLERSRFGLEQTTLDLLRAEEDFKLAISDTATSELEIKRMEEDLHMLRKDMHVERKELAGEERAFMIERIQMMMNLGGAAAQLPSLLNAINESNISQIASMKKVSQGLKHLRVDTDAMSKSLSGIKAGFGGMGAGAKGAIPGLKGVAGGIKGVVTSMGPLTIGITAIIAVWQAWEHNVFGVRDAFHGFVDALQETYKFIKQFMAPLGYLIDAIGALTGVSNESVDAWQQFEKQERALKKALDAGVITMETYEDQIWQAQYAADSASGKLSKMSETTKDLDENTLNVLETMGLTESKLKELKTQTGLNQQHFEKLNTTVNTATREITLLNNTGGMSRDVFETWNGTVNMHTESMDTNTKTIDNGTDTIIQHTDAVSADMQILRAHTQETLANSRAMLNEHITSFDAAANAILTHEDRLRTNLASMSNWAKNYKAKLAESARNAAEFVTTTSSEFKQLVANLAADGHDIAGTLRLMGVTSDDVAGMVNTALDSTAQTSSETAAVIQDSMSGAGDAMHGFASDTTTAAGKVKVTLKDMHLEIAAFEAALKKNDDFTELTIRNILNGFQAMTKAAQTEYEKIMILKANSLLGGNTSVDSLADALTITEQARTGNWANPTHAEGIGANMQHHGPGERSNKANDLLKKGYYVVDPVGDGVWRKSHSDSYKLGKKHHSKTGKPRGVALWDGRDFKIYGPGTPEYKERFGISGYTTKYTTGGPSSRSVPLEISLGFSLDLPDKEPATEKEYVQSDNTESINAEDDQRQILEQNVM